MSDNYGTLWEMLDKRLDSIERMASKTEQDIAVIKDRQVSVISDLSAMKNTIYGNGKRGLVTEVALARRESAFLGAGMGVVVSFILALIKGK